MRCKARFKFGFFFQAEDGIRDLVRSRGLGDVYKRQGYLRERSALKIWASLHGVVMLAEQGLLTGEVGHILSLIHI